MQEESGETTVKKSENVYYQAQAILARRDHSEHEVRMKLAKKGFSEVQIDEAIEILCDQKLIDDEKFAAMYVTNTLRFKNVGPRWLVHKLKEKRIATELIEPAVYGVIDEDKEHALATDAASAWRRSHAKHAEDRDRLTRFLRSRGFSFEAAAQAADIDENE